MTSVMSPYLVKYSLRLSETIKQIISYNKIFQRYISLVVKHRIILIQRSIEKRFYRNAYLSFFLYESVPLRKYRPDKMWNRDGNPNYPFAQASVN